MKITLFILFYIFSFNTAYGCKPGEIIPGVTKEVVSVFSALDFQDIIQEIKEEFESKNPEVLLHVFKGASRELGYLIREKSPVSRVDIVVSSSPELMEDFLLSDYLDWYIIFGKDELCLVYTQNSKYAQRINGQNWYKIISQEGVKLARTDENLEHLGYRTLTSWRLADIYYKENISEALFRNCPMHNIYPDAESLYLSLIAGDTDYAFHYLSFAKRKGLAYLRLPVQINLASDEFSSFYAQASVDVSGKDRESFLSLRGKTIVYAIGFLKSSISKGWPKRFFKFLFSGQAEAIFRRNGIEFDSPLRCQGKIPQEFKELCSGGD